MPGRWLWRWLWLLLDHCADSGDSVWETELAAVATLVGQFDPRATRVGLVIFRGDAVLGTPGAALIVPLTSNYDEVRRGLRELQYHSGADSTRAAPEISRAQADSLPHFLEPR